MAHVRKFQAPKHPLAKKAPHSAAPEAPIHKKAREAFSTSDPRIDVLVFRRQDGSYYARIKFYSRVKPNYLVQGDIELSNRSTSTAEHEVTVWAGAAAEHLGEIYGDNFDPVAGAREGLRQFQSVMRKWDEETRRVPSG